PSTPPRASMFPSTFTPPSPISVTLPAVPLFADVLIDLRVMVPALSDPACATTVTEPPTAPAVLVLVLIATLSSFTEQPLADGRAKKKRVSVSNTCPGVGGAKSNPADTNRLPPLPFFPERLIVAKPSERTSPEAIIARSRPFELTIRFLVRITS